MQKTKKNVKWGAGLRRVVRAQNINELDRYGGYGHMRDVFLEKRRTGTTQIWMGIESQGYGD